MSKFISKVQTIHIFPHAGLKIPNLVQRLLSIGKEEAAQIILKEADTGTDKLELALRERSREEELIISYPYARVLTDVNRLEPEKMVPDSPYHGKALLKMDSKLREKLVEEYILPWQKEVIEVVKSNPGAIVFHWHTMDTYGTGKSTVASTNEHGSLRPLGQIIARGDALNFTVSSYFPDFKDQFQVAEGVKESDVPSIIRIFDKNIRHLDQKDGDGFQSERPYKIFGTKEDGSRITGATLLNLVSLAQGESSAPQLCVEFRKDILITPGAVDSVIEATAEILEFFSRH